MDIFKGQYFPLSACLEELLSLVMVLGGSSENSRFSPHTAGRILVDEISNHVACLINAFKELHNSYAYDNVKIS